eukprot:364246-Chlamydomonas_euryale.AAC.10
MPLCNNASKQTVCMVSLGPCITHCDCLVQVSMVAVEIGGDVNVHNVAILQLARIWDAMADDLHTCKGFWVRDLELGFRIFVHKKLWHARPTRAHKRLWHARPTRAGIAGWK